MPTIVASVLMLLTLGCGGGAKRNPEVIEAIDLADRLYGRGAIEDALARLDEARTLAPDDFEVLYRLGIMRLDTDTETAMADLARAAELRPEHPGPPTFIAFGHLSYSDFQTGGRFLEEGLALAGARLRYSLADTAEAARLGLEALDRLDPVAASEAFSEALDQDGQNAVLWYLKARALFRSRRFPEAREALEEALTQDPKLAPAHSLFAEWHLLHDDPEAAKVEIDRALAEDPELGDAYFQQGQYSLAGSEYRDSVVGFWHAVLADPTVPRHHESLGNGLLFANSPHGALHLRNLEWLNSFLKRRRTLANRN
jgi:tetratricopeptide (TPR) repeat protein